jgi:hypothetical protein
MRVILSAVALAAACGVALAQQHIETNEDVLKFVGEPGSGSQMQIEWIAGELSGQAVKSAPYSAEAVTEVTQALADGNRISRKTTTKLYRDSQGRTRREQSLGAIGPWATEGTGNERSVVIQDPVAGVTYILDPAKQTARKLATFEERIEAPASSDNTVEHTVERRVFISHSADGAPPSGSVVFHTSSDEQTVSRQVKHEQLGKQMIEGVEAEGTRAVITIPAGQIGNLRPIEVVSEKWYSPRLQVVVMSRQSDPRSGETVYRLSNINLAEPTPSLFQLPPGYTLEEGSGNMLYRRIEVKK